MTLASLMAVDRQFPCAQCGANLTFAPGADALTCEYCGFVNEIPTLDTAVVERDYEAHLAEAERDAAVVEVLTVKCTNCGAETTLDPTVVADACPFCGSDVVSTGRSTRLLKPEAVLPFHVVKDEAQAAFRKWLHSRWFAPNALKRRARREGGLDGMYLPFWTYDCRTETDYTGQRGEDYYVTESYTAMENGRSVRKTRRVRKTRWYSASGRVRNTFDDVVVAATTSLPRPLLQALEPWDLDQLAPYQDAYLSGFRTESYHVGLAEGFELAKDIMDGTIRQTVRRDIGGDRQRIFSMRTRYDDVTFKHVLFPVWISAYRFGDTTYRFLVNARTGEVQGERPWSWIKITLAVLAALVAALVFYFVFGEGR